MYMSVFLCVTPPFSWCRGYSSINLSFKLWINSGLYSFRTSVTANWSVLGRTRIGYLFKPESFKGIPNNISAVDTLLLWKLWYWKMVLSKFVSLLNSCGFCCQKFAGESVRQLYSGNTERCVGRLTFSTCKHKRLRVFLYSSSWFVTTSSSLNDSCKGPRNASVSCRLSFQGATLARKIICCT